MHALSASRWLVATVLALASTEPSLAGSLQLHGSSSISGTGSISLSGGSTFALGNGSGVGSAGSGSSGVSTLPWAVSPSGNGSNTPLSFSSSSGGGSDGGGSSGGGLVWGDPLSADVGDFGKVHTRLHYFSQSGTNGAQQAVGINFSIRY